MAYWGCGTERNRLGWALLVLASTTGAALFVMGAAKLDACAYIRPAVPHCHASPRAMIIAGALLVALSTAPLVYFSGCSTHPEEKNAARQQDGRSDITVVRQGHNGIALHYKYDSAGRLVVAPDRFTEEAATRPMGPMIPAYRPGSAADRPGAWDQQGGSQLWAGGGGGGGGGFGAGARAPPRLSEVYQSREAPYPERSRGPSAASAAGVWGAPLRQSSMQRQASAQRPASAQRQASVHLQPLHEHHHPPARQARQQAPSQQDVRSERGGSPAGKGDDSDLYSISHA